MNQQETSNQAAAEQEPKAEGPAATPSDLETAVRRLDEEKQRAESYYASWQRAAADFANYKRRIEQERTEAAKFANAMLILNILPILDDLERAWNNISVELAGLTWIDGIQLIYRKLQAILEAQQLKPIEAVGQPFDPNLHEAVLRAPGEEGKVLAELQRGYTLNGRVIRPALVKVGTGADAALTQDQEPDPTTQASPEAS